MKEVINHFDRSYIINLEERVDRRKEVVREFARIGLNIPNEKVKFYPARRPSDKGGFVDIGTRGCFTSHRSILDLAERDGLKNVLIFEDDVCFRKLSNFFLQELVAHLCQATWDVIYFGYLLPSDGSLTGPLIAWKGDILGAHFYAVNGHFISTMSQYMRECEARPRDHPDGGPMPADGAYNHVRHVFPNINLLLAVPSLAYQRSSRSDLTPHPILDEVAWFAPLVQSIRKIKRRIRATTDKRKLHGRPNT